MKHQPAGRTEDNAPNAPPVYPWLLVFLATLVCYLPALRGGFIWNDSDYVTAAGLRNALGLRRIWTEIGVTQQYYPLLHSAFWLEHLLWGDSPLGYHAVNVFLHAAAAVLFGLALQRLLAGGPPRGARHWDYSGAPWIAALLFALHPVNVESVAWISEEKNTLSLVLYLAAALLYLDFDGKRRRGPYAAASALFLCALLSKTNTATLPAALLVAIWWRRGKIEARKDVLPLVPWLFIGASFGLFSSWVERNYAGAKGTEFDLSGVDRLLVAGRAILVYGSHLAFPARLNFIYSRWIPDAADWWQWLCLLAVAAVVVVLWMLRGRSRAPIAAVLLFLGSLVPALGFVNLYGARYSWVWDHWQYLPDLGLLALSAAGIAAVLNYLKGRFRFAGAAGALVVALALGPMTAARCAMFHDNITLFTETIARNPGCGMAYNNLGCEMDAMPDGSTQAMALYEKALSIDPSSPEAHNNLGNDLEKIPGRMAEAELHYRAAIRAEPDFAEAHSNLGRALGKEGKTDESIAEFRLAVQFRPKYPKDYFQLGNALAARGSQVEAVGAFEQAVRLNPGFVQAHNNLGLALSGIAGRMGDAVREYQIALSIDPGIPQTHANLGVALGAIPGKQQEAIAQLRESLRLSPSYADAHYYLANILIEKGEVAEAIRNYEDALRIQPAFVDASNRLGMVLCRIGEPEKGLPYIEQAIRIAPDFAPAHFARGIALLQSGRRAQAAEEFTQVLRLRPGDPGALRMMREIEQRK